MVGCCGRAATSSPPPAPTGPAAGWPGSAGTTRTCPGTPRSCGWASSTSTATVRRCAAGAGWPGGGPEPGARAVSVGQPTVVADGTWSSSATPGGGGSPGAGRRGAGASDAHRRRGRVPRAGLGTRPDDDGRAGRRLARLPATARRAIDGIVVLGARGRPGGRPSTSRACRWSGVCASEGRPAWIGATPESPATVWSVGAGAGVPAAALVDGRAGWSVRTTCRSASRSGLDGPGGRPVPRPGLPAPPPRDDGPEGRPAAAGRVLPFGARPATPRPGSTRWSSSSPPGASPWPRSTTPGAPATAGPSAAACEGRWGIADSDDCVDAGGPPGRHRGWSTAGRWPSGARAPVGSRRSCALARTEVFAAGTSLVRGDRPRSPWPPPPTTSSRATSTGWSAPCPGRTAEYRSPAHRWHLVGAIEAAVLILQGLDDPVVPASQATAMVEALRARGRRCEYLAFAGEGHGFRRAETIEACPRRRAGLLPGDPVCRGGRCRGGWLVTLDTTPGDDRPVAVPGLERDMARQLGEWAAARFSGWEPEDGDAALYGASALFAGVTALFSTIALYRVWAELAVGPYVAAALVALVLGRLRRRVRVRTGPGAARGRPDPRARTPPSPRDRVAGEPGGAVPLRAGRGHPGPAGPRGHLAQRGRPQPATSSPRWW